MLDFSDPQIWWFLTRASAIVAWVLLTVTALWGILLKTRILRGADNPDWLKVTHRYISGLAMTMVAVHIVTLLLDDYIDFGWADVLIPFATSFEPLPVALGVIAFWLLVAIQVTALLAKWLPEAFWKAVHLSSYGVLLLVALHSGLVGTDVGTPWYTAVSLVLITTATLAVVIRFIIAGREKPAPRKTPATVAAPQGDAIRAMPASNFTARVVDRVDSGSGLALITLTPVDKNLELEWEAGAHLTLHLGNGLERQYSLAGDPAEQDSLLIGVKNTGGPGGGSTWVHENLHVGDEILCDFPRNHFPLKPARRYQFIASGIGITPLRSMLYALPASREWTLLYIARSAKDMLFAEELVELYGERVSLWATGDRGSRPDLASLIDPAAEVYACGSAAVLDELERIVPARRLHLERFEPKVRVSGRVGQAFSVLAATSGVSVAVNPGETVVGALAKSGVVLPVSCNRGVCGTCEVRVLEGQPEHLDSVMSDADKDELGIMYPCVSRSLSAELTLEV
ncbi:MAG: 2Fe-2S iron-sulfur cluster binding domain-containing protein [Pontimonas sp.]|nr:2Fe-2S iron-sulfur cluster binding domain-containing protein [Pontimonas sp.]